MNELGGRPYKNTVRTNAVFARSMRMAKRRAERKAKQKALDLAMQTITIINEPARNPSWNPVK